jgi:hypothetical protein
MSSSKAVPDDLELIRGIGPSARRWLAETFDVDTFAALADLSEEELINRIRAENKPWMRWAKDWPTEAAKKAAEMEAEAEARQPAPAPGKRNKEAWDTLALYFVEFQSRQVPGKPAELQTKVVFEGPGPQTQETVPGIDQDRICQWIFEHLDGTLRAMPAAETLPGAETTPQETRPSAVSVSQLRLFQPAGASSPLFSYSSERRQLSMVRADQPFDLEAILEESRPQASANGRIAFNVQFHVKNWDTRKSTTLGTVEPKVIEGQAAYSALLPGIRLPRGKYRLQVLVPARPRPVVLGPIEIPFLSVW